MSNYDKTIISLQKAVELLPNNSRIWFNLFNLLDFMKENKEAQKALEYYPNTKDKSDLLNFIEAN